MTTTTTTTTPQGGRMSTTITPAVPVYMAAGDVEYDAAEAAIDINELIARLEEARDDGATDVVGLSGNYRGARYVRLSLPEFDEEAV